jgi:hypothetical protein
MLFLNHVNTVAVLPILRELQNSGAEVLSLDRLTQSYSAFVVDYCFNAGARRCVQ